MIQIAKFEKVSYEEWEKAFMKLYDEVMIAQIKAEHEEGVEFEYVRNEEHFNSLSHTIYDDIKLPTRATSGSAGYDFYFPMGTTTLNMGVSTTIPTGIKCKIEEGWVLKLYPRSSLGFKHRLQLDNTVGIIDSDYYNNSGNEGHIYIKITNDCKDAEPCTLEHDERYAQGIFVPYGITVDDAPLNAQREGGMGSTGDK